MQRSDSAILAKIFFFNGKACRKLCRIFKLWNKKDEPLKKANVMAGCSEVTVNLLC